MSDGGKHAQDAEIWGVKRGEWLLFLATLGLWYATWRLVRGADQNAERQLRAHVLFDRGQLRIADDHNLALYGYGIQNLVVRNTGQTPAYNFQYSIKSAVMPRGESPVTVTFQPPSKRETTDIGAGVYHELRFADADINNLGRVVVVSPEQLELLKKGDLVVYIWVAGTYRDGFQRGQRTRFILVADHAGGSWDMRSIDMASTDPFMTEHKFLRSLERPETRVINTN